MPRLHRRRKEACAAGEGRRACGRRGSGVTAEQTVVKASALAYLLPLAGLFVGMLLGALIAPQSETAGSAFGGVIGLAAALIGLTATEKKRSQSGKYAPKLLRVISAADALKN